MREGRREGRGARGRLRWRRAPSLHNMAGAEPFAAVLAALRGCYAEAAPLETFIRRLRESGTGEAEVLRGDDAPCYRTFVGQCVVCVPRGARAIPRPFTFQQVGGRDRAVARSHLRRSRGGRTSAALAEDRAPTGVGWWLGRHRVRRRTTPPHPHPHHLHVGGAGLPRAAGESGEGRCRP